MQQLINDIVSLLSVHPEGLGEYELLQNLRDCQAMQALGGTGNQALFRQHFLLMHCLYRLQLEVAEKGQELQIDPLSIRLVLRPTTDPGLTTTTSDKKLRDYYLDMVNIEATTEEIDALLGNFWQAFHDYLHGDEALSILGLEIGVTMDEITQRYRELIARHHPDKGGDHHTFIRIRHAYESLQRNKIR